MSHGRRAVGCLRRYAKANRFNYLWTLTYREAPSSRKEVTRDLMRFFAGLAVHLGELAVCAVIERGKQATQRLHVHLAMRGRIDHQEMEWLWGHGYVFYGDPNKHPGRSDVAKLASYLSKYLGKELDQDEAGTVDRDPGDHRWYHTQVGTPQSTTHRFELPNAAEAWLELFMNGHPHKGSWGQAGIDYAFGRHYRWDIRLWWPGPEG